MSILPFSAENIEGPHSEYQRLLRWWLRLQEVALHDDFDAELDTALALFDACYRFKEWVKVSGSGNVVNFDKESDRAAWDQVRDVVNRLKHLRISSPSADASFSIGRTYDHWSEKKWRMRIVFNEESIDLMDLAGRAVGSCKTLAQGIPSGIWDNVGGVRRTHEEVGFSPRNQKEKEQDLNDV